MKRKSALISAAYKVLFVLGLIFLAHHVSVAAIHPIGIGHDSDMYNNGVNNPDLAVGQQLVPFFDFYSYWDTTAVDPYGFDFRLLPSSLGICLLPSSDCGFSIPVEGILTSHFGPRWGRHHNGVDIDLETGDTVKAAFDGVVRVSGYNPGGFGNFIVVRHYNGLETVYGHLSQRLASSGEIVNAGQVIGLGGNTGRSTGSHLHFETRFLGQPFDPTKLISFEAGTMHQDTLAIEASMFNKGASHADHAGEAKVGAAKAAYKYHKIRSGDTLGAIARRYHTTVKNLCRLNHISTRKILRPGTRLRVR